MTKSKRKNKREQAIVRSKDWEGFFEELQRENDRAAAIVGASFLEEHLRQLIGSFLVDDKNSIQELFDGLYPPLGGFSAKIKMAYCLGLISAEERNDLDSIRCVRNDFAHGLQGMSFETVGVVKNCQSLEIPKRVLTQDIQISSPRDLFISSVAILANQLAVRAIDIKDKRLKERAKFELIRYSTVK